MIIQHYSSQNGLSIFLLKKIKIEARSCPVGEFFYMLEAGSVCNILHCRVNCTVGYLEKCIRVEMEYDGQQERRNR